MLRYNCCPCTVVQTFHTLPEGEPVYGVTSIADEVYVLRDKERDQVEVYDVIKYRLQRRLAVPNIRGVRDMTSCEHYRCVYIANYSGECVHRLDVQGTSTRWFVNDKPRGISVNAEHNVLVTCCVIRKIKEFSSHGDLLRELTLPGEVIHPIHALQTRSDFIVSHGDLSDTVHRVCKISADGRDVIQSHGGQRGSNIGQYYVPIHLAVDNNEFVFVADVNNQRVTLLSPTLDSIHQVVSRKDLKGVPSRLCLDINRRRLYVVDNQWNDDTYTAGHVVVFSV